ncbi:hypothetical protein [Ensifer sp. 4252]|uniref:hypothetical protein n=1 Tax=Ensifer sp. 4252 TaxID=3373915 RepID=UPI003D1D5743
MKGTFRDYREPAASFMPANALILLVNPPFRWPQKTPRWLMKLEAAYPKSCRQKKNRASNETRFFVLQSGTEVAGVWTD